jgi:hypothetical protein
MCNLPNNHNSNIQCDKFSHMHTNLIVEPKFINGIGVTQMHTNEKNEKNHTSTIRWNLSAYYWKFHMFMHIDVKIFHLVMGTFGH